MSGDFRAFGWLRDGAVAASAALLGMPSTLVFFRGDHQSVSDMFSGLARMPLGEWAFLLAALSGPAALLGLLSGAFARHFSYSGKRCAALAGGAAFGSSILGHGAFYWWLSMVL